MIIDRKTSTDVLNVSRRAVSLGFGAGALVLATGLPVFAEEAKPEEPKWGGDGMPHGLRDDPTLTATASSWVLVSELRGTPRPSVRFELRRSDRWVSEEAAADYRTFNDTELNVSWSLLPLLQLSSQAVYQQREEDDWFYRNTLTWTPLTGGSMLFRFFVNHQEDTRTDYRQRGGGASVTWRPRPRLDLFASVDKSIVDQLGERNDPLSYTLRGAWSF